MSHAIVGKWGKNLAIRVPMDVARAAGLTDGEKVQIETQDGDILVRRLAFREQARAQAAAAAEDIIAESRLHPLGDISIADLIGQGRRE